MDAKQRKVSLRILGVALAVGAGLELLLLGRYIRELSAVWSEAVASGQSGTVWANAASLALFTLLMLAAVAGGIQLLRLRRSGFWFALAGVVPQLASVVVSGFQYKLAMFGVVAVGVAGNNEKRRIGLFIEMGSQLLLGFEDSSQWAVQLNVRAIGVLILLLATLKREQGVENVTPQNVETTG